jgi:hypothetical protein
MDRGELRARVDGDPFVVSEALPTERAITEQVAAFKNLEI